MRKRFLLIMSFLIFLSSCGIYKDYVANDEKIREKLTKEEKLRNEKLTEEEKLRNEKIRNDEIKAKELEIKEINDCIVKFKKEHKKSPLDPKMVCSFDNFNKIMDKRYEYNDE